MASSHLAGFPRREAEGARGAAPQRPVTPRSRSDRRRNSSTVVSSAIEITTRIVATATVPSQTRVSFTTPSPCNRTIQPVLPTSWMVQNGSASSLFGAPFGIAFVSF
jgi:hypothetical protein